MEIKIYATFILIIFNIVNDNHSHLGRRFYHATQEKARVFFN